MAVDDHGIECPNCEGWMQLHYTIFDGEGYYTGRCPHCSQIVNEFPEDMKTAPTHEEDEYAGKGEYIVRIMKPGEKPIGCRYESKTEARDIVWNTAIIPGGSVSLICPMGRGDITRRWPANPDNLGNVMHGRVDTCIACIGKLKRSLQDDLEPSLEEYDNLARKASRCIPGLYGFGAAEIYGWVRIDIFSATKNGGRMDRARIMHLIAELEDLKTKYEGAIQ